MNMHLNVKSASMLLFCLTLVTPMWVSLDQPRAIAQVQPTSAGEAEVANQLFREGLQLVQAGKLQDAIEKYQQVLEIVGGGHNRSDEGAILSRIGEVYESLGQYDQALNSYQQALAIYQKVGDRSQTGIILNNMAGVYNRLRQYKKALDYLQQVLVINQELGERSGEGTTLNNIGSVYDSLGQYNQALDYYQKSLVIRKETKNRHREVVILDNIGTIYKKLGHFNKALDFYQQALAINQELGDRSGEGTTLNNIGSAYDSLGQYNRALEFYQQALAISKELRDRSGESTILNNVGVVYDSLGQYERALELYEQALLIRKEVGDRRGEGTTLNNIAAVYDSLKQYAEALNYYQKALTIRKEVGDRYGEGITITRMGEVYNYLGQHNKALDLLQQALAIRKEIDDQPGEGVTLNNMGRVYYNLGQHKKALDSLQQALAIHKKLINPPEASTTLNNIGALLVLSRQFNAAEKPLYEAISLYESLRPGLSDRNKISFSDQNKSSYHWLQDALVQQDRIETALEISERSRGRALVELLASRLSDSSPEVIHQSSQPLTLNQIKQVAQQQKATLVQYSKVADNFYIWVIRPDGTIAFRQIPTKVDNVSIAKLTVSARNLIGVRSRTSIAKVQSTPDTAVIDTDAQTNSIAALKKLHQRLIEPIADLLPQNDRDRVIFLPQGELFLVPFAALMDANGKALIERHTILTAPSIATLKLTAEKRNAKRSHNQSALVIGNPTMPMMATGALTALPGSEAEAKAIAPLLKTQALTGAAATKSTVLKQMPQAGIIHLATHGLLDTIAGEIPGAIALAPDRPHQINDGLLTANEIFDLKLNADLAVLSACSTGKGDITGDGVIGLSRSLIAAGVPSIVVSLWDVDDQSTSFLMQEFYRNLQTMDKAQALRQAMLTTMRQKNYQSPYHWAAFTLIGEAQ